MKPWDGKKTPESHEVERHLRQTFPDTDAYRYNVASIRVRIVDPRFEGMSIARREELVLPLIRELPEDIQMDIVLLLTLSPSEIGNAERFSVINLEFEHPSPSLL